MPIQREDLHAGSRVQDASNGSACDGQPPAVCVERDISNVGEVAAQGDGFGGRCCIPDLHGTVPTSGGQPPTVRAERHTRDGVLVAVQDEGLILGG